MTDTPRAIMATYMTLKHIQGRNAFQIVAEVDAANISEVLRVIGPPDSSKQIVLGITKLELENDDAQAPDEI